MAIANAKYGTVIHTVYGKYEDDFSRLKVFGNPCTLNFKYWTANDLWDNV